MQFDQELHAAEFFAGIGLVHAGLERAGIEVSWANDIEPIKHAVYKSNFSADHYLVRDIREVDGHDIPSVDLATASFPCTDLSLAGDRRGLRGPGSSMLWQFTRILNEMGERRPRCLLLENVLGFATSRDGQDLDSAVAALNDLGYSCDVFTIDAARFVPQSRPRLFIVGLLDPPDSFLVLDDWVRPAKLAGRIPSGRKTHTVSIPQPIDRLIGLGDLVRRLEPDDERWWEDDRTERFVDSLSELQMQRLTQLKARRSLSWRTAYRRTRHGVAVWEIRSDEIAGCLRTARGGSSKQALVEVGRGDIRVRWLMPSECAALMGAPDLDLGEVTTNQALFGLGDAVCVPVIEWIACHYLVPCLTGRKGAKSA